MHRLILIELRGQIRILGSNYDHIELLIKQNVQLYPRFIDFNLNEVTAAANCR